MASLSVKTTGDRADITITVPADDRWPLKLNLNFWNKLKAVWAIFTNQEMRISGPMEWKMLGQVGVPPKEG